MILQPGTPHTFKGNRRFRPGVALIWVVITAMVLLGMVGLAIDTGRVLLASHQLQNAADAAALAGAYYVRTDTLQARLAAMNTAGANEAEGAAIAITDNPSNDPAGQIVIGKYDRDTGAFTPTLNSPNAVKVITQRSATQNGSLPLIFGPIFGVSVSNIQRQAIAMVGGGTGAGLLALSPDGPGLILKGTVNLNVDGGAVWVDASSNPVLVDGASGTVTAHDGIHVVAPSADIGPPNYFGTVAANSAYVVDPLQFLSDEPPSKPSTDLGSISNSGNNNITLNPGYYSGGIKQVNGSMTMNPGIYYVDNGFEINGGNLTGNHVMIYVNSGDLNLGGNGVISITALDDGSIYEGVSIFQSPSDTTDATITGKNNTTNIEGTLYLPNNKIILKGTGDLTAGDQLVANKVQLDGTGTITIHYDGRNPAPGNKVFLVK